MLAPHVEKKSIRKRLEQVAKIINPTNDKFSLDEPDHLLIEECDKLLKTYWEYMAYEQWFATK